jgi:hypothetical protein
MSARLLLAFVLAGSMLRAETRWTRIASPNFEMYSTAGEKTARETLQYFEEVRSFFVQATQHAIRKPLPVRIVAFNSPKEFDPYRINAAATAYYHGTDECDYIVMSHAGWDTFPLATHEYVHLVIRHANLNFPPWLNEGLAEVYSTLKPFGNKIIVGSLIPGRRQGLFIEKWIPLAVILSVDHDSPYYNEKNQAGGFYNEAWALTHMLMLDAEYRPKFAQAMAIISGGKGSQETLETIYGKPLAAIEGDLLRYMRGDRFQGVVFPAKLENASELRIEPAPPFDLKLTLIDLRNRPAREDETRHALEELAAEDPHRPEPHAMLGYLAWRTNSRDEAVKQMAQAFDLGSRSAKMLWDYGRLAEQNSDGADSTRAFTELLKLEPDRTDVRIELAALQLRLNQPKAVLETLKPVKRITDEVAARFFTIKAWAQLQTGDLEAARANAEQLAKYVKTPEERDRSEALKRYLADPKPVQTAVMLAEENSETRPHLEYRPNPGSTPQRAEKPSFAGKLVGLECSGVKAKLALETADGKKVLRIDDPDKVIINENGAEKLDLVCGPQTPARQVRIEYDAPGAADAGIDGVVRVIHLEH